MDSLKEEYCFKFNTLLFLFKNRQIPSICFAKMTNAKNTKKKLSLSTLIFTALLLGALFGVGLHYLIPAGHIRDDIIIEGVLYVVGQGFIRLMQMLVVPLVFCSPVCGSMAIGDTKTLGRFHLVTP